MEDERYFRPLFKRNSAFEWTYLTYIKKRKPVFFLLDLGCYYRECYWRYEKGTLKSFDHPLQCYIGSNSAERDISIYRQHAHVKQIRSMLRGCLFSPIHLLYHRHRFQVEIKCSSMHLQHLNIFNLHTRTIGTFVLSSYLLLQSALASLVDPGHISYLELNLTTRVVSIDPEQFREGQYKKGS